MDIKKIIFDDELYPRFEPNQATIQKYSESIEFLPAIYVNQNFVLIDGFHRWKAHLLVGETEIKAEVIKTKNDIELKKLAYQYNSNHGLQLSDKEKKVYAQQMYGEFDTKALAVILSVNESTITRWTSSQAKAAKDERNRKIIDLYLKAEYTQQMIGEIVGVTRKQVGNIIDGNKTQLPEITNPYLYNIWNVSKQDNDRKHFGAFPEVFMENLLHYHTKPFDVVYDPFAGGGTTIDVCKRMMRRYYVSDRKVIPGREKDIKEYDITNGFPENLPKPDFVFLDPPYWKQAKGKYSDSESDLGNMSIDEFNDNMKLILNDVKTRKINRVAIVIQPTQYANDFIYKDHIFDFAAMLEGYEIEMRYILPYSTEQYKPQNVIKAKQEQKCLVLNRDLVVWKLK